MTGRPNPIPLEQALDMVEAFVRARRQVRLTDLAAAMDLGISTVRHYARELELDGRLHKVKPFGVGLPRSAVWAAGPAPFVEEPAEHEAVHVMVQKWKAGPTRTSWLEAHFFGRVAAHGARA
jgi:hypothetical protein